MTTATDATYRFEPGHSRFTVQAFTTGLLSFLGHSPTFAIRAFEGEVGLNPPASGGTWCWLTARADSLEMLGNVRPQERAEIEGRVREEVLRTVTYPEITFGSVDVSAVPASAGRLRLGMRGQLTLRGLRNPLQIDADLSLVADGARLAGEFALRPSAYGIRPFTALGGAIRLEDRLLFTFDLVGRKAPPPAESIAGARRQLGVPGVVRAG